MADSQPVTHEFTTAGAGTFRTDPVPAQGKRDIVWSIEVSANSAQVGDTLDVVIQHTNSPKSLLSTSNDNYWETYYTFTQIVGNAAVPSNVHKSMADAGSNGNLKPIGMYWRVKRTIAGGTAAFTGKVRASHNAAVVSG